jgi:arsenate reductase (thioredoxin)
MEITIREAMTSDYNAVSQLLLSNKLPVQDIDKALPNFFVAVFNNELAGVIGLEKYDQYGLLRSMATDFSHRNQGIASKLIDALFQYASTIGLKEIYLLTETAKEFFVKKEFIHIQREEAPDAVKKSAEFSHLCPTSATVMKKSIVTNGLSATNLKKKKVLFVCIENSNRSQMSQAFAIIHGGNTTEAFSAGSTPSGIVNPKAVAAMKELGYDLNVHDSKSLDEVKQFAPFDAVVTMGCGDACPWMPAKKFIDWQIPDPKHLEPPEFNKIRDFIEQKVRGLLHDL